MIETAIQPKKKGFFVKYKKEIQAYSLIAFPLAWWGVFFLIAFFNAVYFSFTDIRFGYDSITQFTLNNYLRIFDKNHLLFDPIFWKSLSNTFIWTIAMMIANNVLGLLFAFLISNLKRGKKLFLALLFWPTLVSAVVGADLTKMIFSSYESGFANQILQIFGLGPVSWFDNAQTSLIGLMITPLLLGFSVKLLIYYASLVSIPESYVEAAKMETNSSAKIFLNIKIPLMKNAIILNTILSLIDGFKVLGPMQLITGGGPDNSTLSTVLYIYQLGFERSRMGQASAYAIILFLIILGASLLQLKFSGKEAETHD